MNILLFQKIFTRSLVAHPASWSLTSPPHKGVAGAGRLPSLLAVATPIAKSLTLPLDIIRKRAFAA